MIPAEPNGPYIDHGATRVVCAEHGVDWAASSIPHAQNYLTKHLREHHLPALVDLDLTQAARWLLVLRDDGLLKNGAYRGALGLWCEMLGLSDDAQALALAEDYAARTEPVTATVPPF